VCGLDASVATEALFFSFFALPLRRKRCFSRFLLFRCDGSVVFLVFCSSAATEALFFLFFALPLRRKQKKALPIT